MTLDTFSGGAREVCAREVCARSNPACKIDNEDAVGLVAAYMERE